MRLQKEGIQSDVPNAEVSVGEHSNSNNRVVEDIRGIVKKLQEGGETEPFNFVKVNLQIKWLCNQACQPIELSVRTMAPSRLGVGNR